MYNQLVELWSAYGYNMNIGGKFLFVWLLFAEKLFRRQIQKRKSGLISLEWG